MSLNRLLFFQRMLVRLRIKLYTNFWGMDIHPTAIISSSARLDKTHPKGIHIGAYSYVAFEAAILTHDMIRLLKVDTTIGECCFIGARSIILPGVKVGDHSVVAAGSVVSKDVPERSIVAGNPAVVKLSDIETATYGRLKIPKDKANDVFRNIK